MLLTAWLTRHAQLGQHHHLLFGGDHELPRGFVAGVAGADIGPWGQPGASATGDVFWFATLPEAWVSSIHCSLPSQRRLLCVRSLREKTLSRKDRGVSTFAGLTLAQQSAGAETLRQQKK